MTPLRAEPAQARQRAARQQQLEQRRKDHGQAETDPHPQPAGGTGKAGDDLIIDGEGNDHFIKGDEGNDVIFLGPGADKVFSEQGDDTIYVLPDGFVDKIRCDDGDQANGATDRVIFVGWRDPLDQVDPYGTCEIVLVTPDLPLGWPYGPVSADPRTQQVTQRTAGTDLPR